MGSFEELQLEAEHNARLMELHKRNPLKSTAAAECWGELRDAVEDVRANADGSIERLVDAFSAFVQQYAEDHPDAPTLKVRA